MISKNNSVRAFLRFPARRWARLIQVLTMTSKQLNLRSGYTLIEILLAVTLGLILMLGVVQIFAMVGDFVNNSQALMELDQNVRSAQLLLQNDLSRYTCRMTPPTDPMAAEGYFRYEEQRLGDVQRLPDPSATVESEFLDENAKGDNDDAIMFTIHDADSPFIGRPAAAGNTILSQDAEVVWYVEGQKLYRRINVLNPGFPDPTKNPTGTVKQASLSDLTFSDYRGGWGTDDKTKDVILDHVIMFDVQAWDPVSKQYLDLGKGQTFNGPQYFDTGSRFKITGEGAKAISIENKMVNAPNKANFEPENYQYNGINLQGIRIKIRVYEPTSGIVRDITVEQDFNTH